jgi:8-amino-7-oxononanoate synthase
LYEAIASNKIFEKAAGKGIVFLPLAEDWVEQEYLTHIVPLWTRQGYSYWLCFHLCLSGYSAFCVDYPTVPKGTGRVRVTLHANNTKAEIDGLISAICEWADEMLQIESNGGGTMPRATRQVYASMAE